MDLFFLENVFSVIFKGLVGGTQLPLGCHLDTVIHFLQIFFSECLTITICNMYTKASIAVSLCSPRSLTQGRTCHLVWDPGC